MIGLDLLTCEMHSEHQLGQEGLQPTYGVRLQGLFWRLWRLLRDSGHFLAAISRTWIYGKFLIPLMFECPYRSNGELH